MGPAGESERSDSAVPAIELHGIVKRFPGVVANDGVELTVQPGSIHAIVGENGAGKSTLMKTLYGAHRPDEGTICVAGEEVTFKSPRDAIDHGIGMVFQHFMLADNLTVWENVVLGSEPGTRWKLGRDEARTRLADISRRYGLGVDPDEPVSELGVGDKQRVEILKVLYRGARIVILDEPTAVLVPQEVRELFASLRELTAEGVTVIFISHKLDEVLSVADHITVIRAGRTVAEVLPAQVTARQLAELMVGHDLPRPTTRGDRPSDRVALDVQHLTVIEDGRVLLDDVTISLHAGEIVGIAGVEGNGQSELLEALIGITSPVTGTITLNGEDITHETTRERRADGLGYVPEDRHKDGIVLTAPLWENVMLGHQGDAPFSSGPWIRRQAARERAEQIVKQYDVRTPNVTVAAMALSGGNQQKLIIGREMTMSPSVLIAAHPTRGIDVGAQAQAWDAIRTARTDGLAVLLVSADLEELVGLSDVLHVMLRGRVVATLDPNKITLGELGEWMTGAKTNETAA
jgi:simple sugar transport system ATP-binding protein